MRHLYYRFRPRLDRRWLVVIGLVAAVAVAASLINWDRVAPPIELLALDGEGRFAHEIEIPADWGDTVTATPDAVARFPLVLAARNAGTRSARPERLTLQLPVRYRLTDAAGQELPGHIPEGSILVSYTIEPRFEPIEPERVPAMLPGYDRLWLEVVVPRYYCVSLADSIPEFVPAPPPPVNALSELTIFYSFEGGDLERRRTGTMKVRLDSAMLAVPMPDPPPSFPMESNPELARPALGPLTHAGSVRVECGEPEAPMVLLSTVWETEAGARLIALDYGGTVRKHLYDLNGDGYVDRESWDPDGTGAFAATRLARLPVPGFLLPAARGAGYDMAAFDALTADSIRQLDPLRRAMPGPGPVPGVATERAAAPEPPPLTREQLPEPRIRPVQPLGRPVSPPPDG